MLFKEKERKRNNSLGIVFRKFYHLSTVRINCLVENLELTEQIIKKIWNVFEYSIVNHIDLLKERHLDQLIMCAIHVSCKVSVLKSIL